MATTLQDLLYGTFTRLNEAVQSTFAQLETGGGNTATLATTATMIDYINEGQAEVATHAFLLPGKGTALFVVGQQIAAFQDLSGSMDRSLGPDGTILWAATDASYDGTALQFAGRGNVRLRFNSYKNPSTAAYGTPGYWWRDGDNNIAIWPPPVYAGALVAYGYCVPPPLTAGMTATWWPDHITQYIEMFAAIRLAQHSYDDPSIFGRVSHLTESFLKGTQDLFARNPATIVEDIGMQGPMSIDLVPKGKK